MAAAPTKMHNDQLPTPRTKRKRGLDRHKLPILLPTMLQNDFKRHETPRANKLPIRQTPQLQAIPMAKTRLRQNKKTQQAMECPHNKPLRQRTKNPPKNQQQPNARMGTNTAQQKKEGGGEEMTAQTRWLASGEITTIIWTPKKRLIQTTTKTKHTDITKRKWVKNRAESK
jgi:hypothetical protein